MATATTADPARAEGAAPRVLAIVVTHQGRRWLRDCLIALNTQTYPSVDVLVVDDASPDSRHSPHVKRIVKRHLTTRRWGFVRTRRALGFGGAINWAMARVRTDAELLLFVHDDAVLDRRSVEHMVARMTTDEDAAIVGPKIVAWDDPSRLEEVGMAVDRFGYPYKGLERGEIDLGQHDVAAEVFYVTSTCMLVRHEVFKQLRGWDDRMKAFSEDLDLCWRARVAGHSIVVEPRAKARHAIALATGQRRSRFTPARYYIRRNRLRAVAKNASWWRLLPLLPQFVLLTFTEMIGFIVLRQPGQIVSLLKALGWNLVTSPQTLSERLRVQRARRISDGRLRRFTVRDSTRVRAYISNQTERLEDAWGRRTELLGRRSRRARQVTRSLTGWPAIAAAVALAGLALGFRHFLWSPPVAVGQLLPYPERATALWETFVSPWQPSGLGAPGPTSPALLLLGAIPPLALGVAAAAQKVLVAVLGAIAFFGAYHLVSEVVDRPARLVAGLAYLFGPLGFAGVREGDLGALAFGAVAPFALRWILEALGWSRPPGWDGGRGASRVALATALSCAFLPGALLLLTGLAALAAALRLVLGPRSQALVGLPVALGGIAGGWLLLLPWSASWWSEGGALRWLVGGVPPPDPSVFSSHGMVSVLLGRTPRGPALLGVAGVVLAVVALVLSTGQRRRLALVLVAVVVASGWLVVAVASGMPSPVGTPTQAGALAALSLAGLAGLAVGAFRLDLPRRRFGWIHVLAMASLAGASALALAALGPALWRGEWTPGRGREGLDPSVMVQIRSLIAAHAGPEGALRVLWVGPGFGVGGNGGAPGYALTGTQGATLADLYARGAANAQAELEQGIAAIQSGTTDVGGHLLGAFSVGHVVLDRAGAAQQWLDQRDLAVIRRHPRYLLLANGATLPRAALFADLPGYIRALAADDPTLGSLRRTKTIASLSRMSPSRYEAHDVSGPGVAWLAETRDRRWSASLAGRPLERVGKAWGNAFALPKDTGSLEIVYRRSGPEAAVVVPLVLAWIVVVGAAATQAAPRATLGSE
jgi:GT2 family glycosyltransferase